jgi:predicted AlkP superfamily pyrophosphatase or phosphodiesterase
MLKPRVLLCSMDGVRPDAIQAAHTPTIDRLAREGASAWTARTVMPSVTLPCHTSMLRGVDTPRHGITSNNFQPLARPVPSLIDQAFDQGRVTGFFYNWEPLRDLAAPGKLHVSGMVGDAKSPQGDDQVAELACLFLPRLDFDLLFVYFGWPDECGHKHGWMSAPYLEAIANADRCLGRVLDTLESLGRAGETTTLVLSDHGGHERTHGTDRDDDILIPWILHGPGVRSGHVLEPSEAPVRIFDTCVTLAHVLGLQPSVEWDGAVITGAFV